jgi:hypothetical protein
MRLAEMAKAIVTTHPWAGINFIEWSPLPVSHLDSMTSLYFVFTVSLGGALPSVGTSGSFRVKR